LGAPLFAVIGYALLVIGHVLFRPSPAAVEAVDKGLNQPMEYMAPPAF
jgi:hypothetical protein